MSGWPVGTDDQPPVLFVEGIRGVRPDAKVATVHLNIHRSLTEAKLVAQDFRDSQSSALSMVAFVPRSYLWIGSCAGALSRGGQPPNPLPSWALPVRR